MPPKDSPKAQTASPQPTPASPLSRDQPSRAATSIQIPMPAWIHTAAAAAWTGWCDQAVTPQFTRCCTQCGELAAAGWMTCEGRPAGILGWA
jgi:hypothetical protein